MTNEEMQREIEKLNLQLRMLARMVLKVAAATMASDAAFNRLREEAQSVGFDSGQLRDSTLAGGSGFQSGGM